MGTLHYAGLQCHVEVQHVPSQRDLCFSRTRGVNPNHEYSSKVIVEGQFFGLGPKNPESIRGNTEIHFVQNVSPTCPQLYFCDS